MARTLTDMELITIATTLARDWKQQNETITQLTNDLEEAHTGIEHLANLIKKDTQ